MTIPQPKYLVIGEILKPWGYRGEVKIKVLTDFPGRLLQLKTVYIGKETRAFKVEHARLHSGFALFKFAGFDTEEAVGKLRGEAVQVLIEDAAQLRKGQYFQHQIIGLAVFTTQESPIGRVEEILETGANDVYLVRKPDGTELLLPAIEQVIRKIDLEQGRMTVELLPGLGE